MASEPGTPAEEPALDDDAYVSVEALVTALVVDEDVQQVDRQTGLAVTLDKLATEFPIELRVETTDSGLELRAAPPTQHVATTVLPVWHQLRVTVVRDTEDTADDATR